MTTAAMPAVFNIPAHRSFGDALAAGLIGRFGHDKLGLASGVVLVPNNRAARSIQEAFVRRSDGGLLLPRLVPVGDPELHERAGGALESLDEPIPPAIEPVDRLMLLSGLIRKQLDCEVAESLRLAAELGRTLDQLLVEEVDPGRLADFAADSPDLSAHWQASLEQLRIILDDWPRLLRERGRVDLAERRRMMLDALTRRWGISPPPFVCAAGVTTAAPSVARLLAAVSRLPNGMVVLPALDLEMPEDEWEALGGSANGRPIESHPQFHLKLLLDRMSVGRGEVRSWRKGGSRGATLDRSRAIANAMTPASFTEKWQRLPPKERRLSGVRALELATPAEEAQAVAIALREAIEQPNITAALVTPDRALAARVSAHLRRWGIEADDSAGMPLSRTPSGSLLLALADAGAERFSPVPLLALLKHPLVAAGEGRLAWLDGVRRLDLALRGPRPSAGLEGITRFLGEQEGREARVRREAAAWWPEAAQRLRAYERALEGERSLAGRLADLREAAAILCGVELWTGPAGRAASEFLAELEEAAEREGPETVRPAEMPALLEDLMGTRPVRPPYGKHPRVFIWGLIEARLQHADVMVVSGLNEGVWPGGLVPDPWLAPRLRAELGLPSLDRRVGLSAHDFVLALGAPRVLVTRARRDARAPAIASRFWLRLEAMTGGMTRAPAYAGWARDLDRAADVEPAKRPAPSPEQRPREMWVTEVDRLKADPFAFYAKRILGLSRLDDVDAEPSAAWRGSAVHAILEAWMKEDNCDPESLAARAEALLSDASTHPLMRALWQPRLMEAIAFIADQMREDAGMGRLPLGAELKGKCEVDGITLRGIVDRIDRLADGTLAIVDYKTGKPPGAKAVAEGYSLQLGLLGLIAELGGFSGIQGTPLCFEYWSLARKNGSLGHVSSPTGGRTGIAPEDFTRLAEDNFREVAEAWLKGTAPFTAMLHPEYAPYGDYNQLSRLDEWYGRDS